MESRVKQKLEKARNDFELYSQNVIILQNDQQKLTQELAILQTGLQDKLRILEAPVLKAQKSFESAQREFARAQNVFNQQQQEYKNVQDSFSVKRDQMAKQLETEKKRLESIISDKTKEITVTNVKMRNAERDIMAYQREQENEEKMAKTKPANDNNHRSGRFVA